MSAKILTSTNQVYGPKNHRKMKARTLTLNDKAQRVRKLKYVKQQPTSRRSAVLTAIFAIALILFIAAQHM